MWGHFCYVFLLIGVARALTPVQMFVGGVGKPKKDHHKNIKSPPPPHNEKRAHGEKVAKRPHMHGDKNS